MEQVCPTCDFGRCDRRHPVRPHFLDVRLRMVWIQADARSCDGCVREELATRMHNEKRGAIRGDPRRLLVSPPLDHVSLGGPTITPNWGSLFRLECSNSGTWRVFMTCLPRTRPPIWRPFSLHFD